MNSALKQDHLNPCSVDSTSLYIIALSAFLVSVPFLLQSNIGLNLADEAYLWYGAQRTATGEIPIRDFQSYEPGRYYWSAAWFQMFGTGILALRISNALFQCIGLCFGLSAARRAVSKWWMLFLLGIVFVVWMFPRHKLFESSITMVGVWFAVFLIENPSPKKHFATGVFVGIAAFLGRNHGIYNCLGFFMLIIFLHWKTGKGSLGRNLSAWAAGVIVGSIPLIYFLVLVPGFFELFWDRILSNFRHGTNLPLPVPWPWTVIGVVRNSLPGNWPYAAFQFFGSLSFLFMPLFYLTALIIALVSSKEFLKRGSLFIACAFVGLFYQNHAFSRPDIGHLAQAFHPFLIGLVAIPHTFGLDKKRGAALILALFLVVVAWSGIWAHEYYHYLLGRWSNNPFVHYKIGKDDILINPGQAKLMDSVAQISSQRSKKEDDILIAPHWPGFYPVLGKKSPVWQTYFLLPATEALQEKMIVQMENAPVQSIIIGDVPLDGRDDLRFRCTHPMIWSHILDKYEIVPTEGLPPNYQLFIRKPQEAASK